MDEQLLELCGDEELVGGVGTVVELVGPLESRLVELTERLGLT